MTNPLTLLARAAGLTEAELRAYLQQRGTYTGKLIAADVRHRPVLLYGAAEASHWDGGDFYRDVPNYGPQGQRTFFHRFLPTAQDASGVSGRLNFAKLY